MDKTQAQFILRCYRSGTSDARDEAFAEALGQVKNDPALREWQDRELAFDRACRDKLRTFPVPGDLRLNILAAHHAQRSQRTGHSRQALLGLAAALILSVGSFFALSQFVSPPSLTASEFTRQALLTGDDPSLLEYFTGDLDAKRAWLSQHNAPSAWELPPELISAKGEGCRTVSIQGNTVTVVCYRLGCGNTVQIYVISRQALSEASPRGELILAELDGHSTARWCDGKFYYVAVSRLPLHRLKDLL